MEHRHLDGFDVLGQHLVDGLDRQLLAGTDEADPLHGRQQQVVVLLQRVADHHAHLDGQAVGQRGHRAEVDHGHPAVGHHHEVAGVGVAVHHSDSRRSVEGQLEKPCAAQVALIGCALANDLRHRLALGPLAHHHLRCAADHVRDQKVRVALVGLGERPLIVGFEAVVEFHLGALDQLIHHALHIGTGGELAQHRRHPTHGLQVGAQRLVSSGVLDLDGHLAAVGPHSLVHLADAGRGHRVVVEGGEPFTPLGAQLPVENPVHFLRRQRRGVLLQFGQGLAVGLAEFLGDRGLEHRQRLAHLHGPALEFTEHVEQLVGCLLHQLGVDVILGLSGQPLADSQGSPARHPDREAGQFGIAPRAPALDVVGHTHIMPAARRGLIGDANNRRVGGVSSAGPGWSGWRCPPRRWRSWWPGERRAARCRAPRR